MQFEAGKTYATRSICDRDTVVNLTVIKRTAKTVVADCGNFGTKRLKINVRDGVEEVKPWGSYSMAPVVDATQEHTA